MSEEVLRSLPHSPEAEEVVLACCVAEPSLADRVAADPLEADLFYLPAHRSIWAQMRALRKKSPGFDFGVLMSFIQDQGQTQNCGGRKELAKIADIPTTKMLPANLDVLRNKAQRRILWRQADRLKNDIFDELRDPQELAQELDSTTSYVLETVSRDRSTSWQDHLLEFQDRFQERWEQSKGQGMLPGIPTGYPSFDDHFNGWQGGKVYVISARPGDGKTALMMNLVQHACDQGCSVGVVSLEMQIYEMVTRAMSLSGKIDSRDLERAKVNKADLSKIMLAMQKQLNWKLQLDDTPSRRPLDLKVLARNWVKNYEVQILFLDYMQLIAGTKGQKQLEVIEEASKTLKWIAKTYNIPVVALAQMRRSDRKGNPTMDLLKGSGAIEEDADVVALLRNDDQEENQSISNVTAIFDKCRGGRTGEVNMVFTKPFTLFQEVNQPSQDWIGGGGGMNEPKNSQDKS